MCTKSVSLRKEDGMLRTEGRLHAAIAVPIHGVERVRVRDGDLARADPNILAVLLVRLVEDGEAAAISGVVDELR